MFSGKQNGPGRCERQIPGPVFESADESKLWERCPEVFAEHPSVCPVRVSSAAGKNASLVSGCWLWFSAVVDDRGFPACVLLRRV